mgnify:CR=1 FL=1
MRENIRSMEEAFKSRYGNFQIAYSFKTNYLKRICEIVKESGGMAEVVSPLEREYARAIGYDPDQIIYNGVIQDPEGKFDLAAAGGMVNVDNLHEYDEISRIAAEKLKGTGKKIRIGVRLNLQIGQSFKSRFGVDVNSLEFYELMNRIHSDQYIDLGGFHCHIGSSRQQEFWGNKATQMINLAKIYKVSYLDMGGGMFGPMEPGLSSQFNGYVGDFGYYADVTAKLMKISFPDESVKLIVEPGTALVGNTMYVSARVTSIKNVDGQDYITVNVNSNNLGMICECRKIPIEIFHCGKPQRSVKNATIAGNTCLEFDYILKGFTGYIAEDDQIIFRNVGAYSIGTSRQFIAPRLEVMNERGELLKLEETWGTIFNPYMEC